MILMGTTRSGTLRLDRRLLIRERASVLRLSIEMIEDIVSNQNIPEDVRADLFRRQFARVIAPHAPFSVAAEQSFRELWKRAFCGKAL